DPHVRDLLSESRQLLVPRLCVCRREHPRRAILHSRRGEHAFHRLQESRREVTSAAAEISQPQTSRIRIACAVFVFVASILVYTLTLAPTVTLVDSGELIVAARSLGVAHPPGFPLYVMFAHLATLVPIGSVAVRVNFASAFFASLACAGVALVVIEAMTTSQIWTSATRSRRKADRKKGKKTAGPAPPPRENSPRSALVLAVS